MLAVTSLSKLHTKYQMHRLVARALQSCHDGLMKSDMRDQPACSLSRACSHAVGSRPDHSTALVVHGDLALHEREARREKDRADKWKAKCQKLRQEAASLRTSAAAAESAWKVLILPQLPWAP